MYLFKSNLYNEIRRFSKILIYGAGCYANMAYEFLKSAGLKELIDSFVVTELKEYREIDGIPVRCVDYITFDDEEMVIFIAVSHVYEKEIVQLLQQKHCLHMIKFADYMLNDDFIERLRTQSDEQFKESIIEEYVWGDKSDSVYEFDKKRKEIEKYISQRNRDCIDWNTIVFISGYMNPRSEKIIGALVKKKYNVIVLEYECCNELVIKEIKGNNITFFHCKDITDVFCKAIQYNPLVYYYEPVWGDCTGPEIMIRHRNLFGKIVFASYDVLNDGYVQISEKDKIMERYCLENADGIVWRWFSKEFLEKKKGFKYKGKSLQFLDYCKGFELDKSIKTDDMLKICFVQGGIYEYLDVNLLKNDGTYIEPARIDTILKKIGNIDGCIFHMFVGFCNASDKDRLRELESEYSNFKVFYGTAHSDLISKISEYDYGCFLMTDGRDIPELESINNISYGSNYINSEGNRFFDYLDAGIPIIATRPKKQCEYFDDLGVLVKMNISNIDIDYLKQNRALYKKNVERAKPEILIDNQITKLIDFFKGL
ncbi:MAG: hypothetical protein HDR17_13295 [Lachnospiraceae bacterium]|nr:hypothetical protein [Lachnospiraceae bacterium]